MARETVGRGGRPAKVAPAAEGRLTGPLQRAAWLLMLSALAIPALVSDDYRWMVLPRPLLGSGNQLGQAFVGQVLVMATLGLAGVLVARRGAVRWHPAMAWALGFLAWASVATAASPGPLSALIGDYRNSQGLLSVVVRSAAFVLVVLLADTGSKVLQGARTLALTGGAVAAVGLLQNVGMDPLGESVLWKAVRSYGTLGNPDMFGGIIVIALFAAMGVALAEKEPVWRWAALAAMVACAAAAVTSYSRAAWIGVVVGLVAFAIVTRATRVPAGWKLPVVVLAVVVAVGALAWMRPSKPGSATDVADRITSAVSATDPDSAARLDMWSTALRAVALRPLVGYGPDTFVLATEPLRTAALAASLPTSRVRTSTHDLPLQVLSDTGVPGLVLWVGALAAVAIASLKRIVRPDRGPAQLRLVMTGLWCGSAAYLADSLFSPSHVVNSLHLWAALGLLIAPCAASLSITPALARRVAGSALGILAALGIVTAIVFLVADHNASTGSDMRLTPEQRISGAAEAARLNPLSVRYAVLHAWALGDRVEELGVAGGDRAEVRTLFAQTLAEARRAASIEPTNQLWRSYVADVLILGARHVDRGLASQALAEARRAVRMSPNDLNARFTLARALWITDPDQARSVLEAVLRVRPAYSEAAIALCQLRVAAGDTRGARQVLRGALAATTDAADRNSLERALAAIP